MINYNTYSPTELMDAVSIKCMGKKRNASIGMALDTLIDLAGTGKEFKGEHDGIDALCYHLDKYTCEKSIEALQKVIHGFNA